MRIAGLAVSMLGLALAAQAMAAGVLVEAENFSAQGGGKVDKNTTRPGTSGGGCITGMDHAGQWQTWKLTVPADGNYRVTLRYAGGRSWAVWRELQIDGKLPAPAFAKIELPSSGGWGRAAADWRNLTLADAAGKPLSVHLAAGEHELRVSNLGGAGENGSANLDAIVFSTADTKPESLLKF